MQGALHLFGQGAARLGIGIVLVAVLMLLAYCGLVFALVAIQAFTTIGA